MAEFRHFWRRRIGVAIGQRDEAGQAYGATAGRGRQGGRRACEGERRNCLCDHRNLRRSGGCGAVEPWGGRIPQQRTDRTSVGRGESVSVVVDMGGCRISKNKKKRRYHRKT